MEVFTPEVFDFLVDYDTSFNKIEDEPKPKPPVIDSWFAKMWNDLIDN